MGERPWVDASRGGSPRPDHPRDRPWSSTCRRWVAATTAAACTGTPALRSARTASARLAPVVTTSSTTTTVPADGGVAPRRSRWAPARLAARPAPDSPAWSASRRLATSSGATVVRRCARIVVAACFAMRSNGSWPRCRVARRREGTGTRSTGPYVVATAADTEAASATPRGRARASRPCSLCARSMARTGPSYAVTAKVVGKPGGHGLGRACAGCAESTAAQPPHSRSPSRSQPAQLRGSTRSTSERTTPSAVSGSSATGHHPAAAGQRRASGLSGSVERAASLDGLWTTRVSPDRTGRSPCGPGSSRCPCRPCSRSSPSWWRPGSAAWGPQSRWRCP